MGGLAGPAPKMLESAGPCCPSGFGCGLRPLIWACDVVTFSNSYGAACGVGCARNCKARQAQQLCLATTALDVTSQTVFNHCSSYRPLDTCAWKDIELGNMSYALRK